MSVWFSWLKPLSCKWYNSVKFTQNISKLFKRPLRNFFFFESIRITSSQNIVRCYISWTYSSDIVVHRDKVLHKINWNWTVRDSEKRKGWNLLVEKAHPFPLNMIFFISLDWIYSIMQQDKRLIDFVFFQLISFVF